MYFYCFNQRYGTDRVVFVPIEKGKGICKGGDYLLLDGIEALCLGETVAFQELYTGKYKGIGNIEVKEQGLISRKTLSFITLFVNYRFTNYKNTIPLFLTNEIDTIIKKTPPTKTSKKVDQILTVFPTVRALIQETTKEERSKTGTVVLHGASTSVQKAKAFWGVKRGSINKVYCTYSQLFHDRKNLTEIILHDQHSRRYKSQKDPRYYVPTVISSIAEQYKTKLSTTGLSLIQ